MIGAVLARLMARKGCKYLNTREIDLFLKDWRDDAVFIYPGDTIASGECRGKQAVREWWMRFYDQFPKSCFAVNGIYVNNFMALAPSNELALKWSVDVADRLGNEFHNHGVSLISIHNGKVVRFEDFIFDLITLKKAWSSSQVQ